MQSKAAVSSAGCSRVRPAWECVPHLWLDSLILQSVSQSDPALNVTHRDVPATTDIPAKAANAALCLRVLVCMCAPAAFFCLGDKVVSVHGYVGVVSVP